MIVSEINLQALSAMPTGGSRFARANQDFIANTPESQTTVAIRQKKAEVAQNIGGARMADQTMRAMLELNAQR